MTQKYVKTPIPPEISDKGGATIQFVDRQTVPLETSVKEAIEGLFVLGQEQLVKSNFFGLMRSASDGIRRDGHARQIGDYITIYPVVTGEFDLDRGWDPERNGVRIIARLLNELELDITKWSFEDATPGKQSFKVNTVSTLGVEGIAEIGKPVAINGSGLPKTDAIRVDWALEGTDKSGTIPAAKVTSDDVRADIAADALAELASEEYDGKTIVFTVRGNFSSAKISATLKCVPIVSDVMYDDQAFADGMHFYTGDSHCLSGTNVVFAPGDRGTIRQTVDGEVKTYDFDIVDSPERCAGGVIPEMRDELEALGFADDADGELTLRLHGGVEGSPDQVITHGVHVWLAS